MTIRGSVATITAGGGVLLLLSAGCGGGATTGRAGPEEPSGGDAVLTAEDLAGHSYSRVEEMIAARVAGVQVQRLPNGDYSLRIRGTGSLTGSNEPLIVIDGMPVQRAVNNTALAAINPEDVARIEVLKDAQSTSFYGARGANGVIIITTRRRQ